MASRKRFIGLCRKVVLYVPKKFDINIIEMKSQQSFSLTKSSNEKALPKRQRLFTWKNLIKGGDCMSRTKNIIPEFTNDEQNYIKEHANFMEEELQFFELRNKRYSYEYCAEKMDMSVSTVKKVAKKTMNKILKVIRHMDI